VAELRKFFRDIGILLAFCGAFYLLTVMVNRLEGDSNTDATDFSPARKRANLLVNSKDWSAASIEFKKLTEQDPFNGYAWEGYSTSLWEIRRSSINELKNLTRSNALDTEKENELDRQIAELNDQIRQVLLQVKKFARYRYSALLRLAALECERGNYDEAMDFLEEFVGRGYQTKRGLHWIENFGSSDVATIDQDPPGWGPRYGTSFRPGKPPQTGKYASFEYKGTLSRLRIPTGTETRLHLEPRFWDLVRRESETPIQF
jgi:tetratricopeptide (TPR) repeat protein